MSTESNSKELVEKKRAETPKGAGTATGWIALVLALLALAASAMAFWSVQESKRNTEGKEAEITKLAAQIENYRAALQNGERERAEINDRLAGIREQQNKLGESLAALYKSRARENLDWAVAEVEHLMVIAIHNLTLQHNVDTALAALQSADDRLRNLGDPDLVDVRKQLAADINTLRSVKPVDITGLSLYLADLVNRVEALPLKDRPADRQPEKEAPDTLPELQPAWKRLLSDVWQELKSLVVITRTGSGSRALLLPEEKYFLYQNLRLQLESARFAALQRDTKSFHASVEIVVEWLKEYFDEGDAGINNIIESLQEMLTLELDPALPDISSSLETLRAYIKDRSAPLPPDAGEPGS